MSWLVDNANGFYILLAVIAAGFVVGWRLNGRVKFLLFAAGALVLIVFVWLLAQFVGSDSKQLEANVHAMADAVVAGKTDDLFKHIARDFDYQGMTRDALYQKARGSIEAHKVKEVRIGSFTANDVSRARKIAKTRFLVSARAAASDQPYMFVTQADFVLEDGQWKLKTMRFYNPLVNQDQEIVLPGLR